MCFPLRSSSRRSRSRERDRERKERSRSHRSRSRDREREYRERSRERDRHYEAESGSSSSRSHRDRDRDRDREREREYSSRRHWNIGKDLIRILEVKLTYFKFSDFLLQSAAQVMRYRCCFNEYSICPWNVACICSVTVFSV